MSAELVDRVFPVQIAPFETVDVYSGVARLSGKIWAREVKLVGSTFDLVGDRRGRLAPGEVDIGVPCRHRTGRHGGVAE